MRHGTSWLNCNFTLSALRRERRCTTGSAAGFARRRILRFLSSGVATGRLRQRSDRPHFRISSQTSTASLCRRWIAPGWKRLRSFVLWAVERFHWVTVALHQSRSGIRAVFEAWGEAFPAQEMGGEELERYYALADFRTDFTQFVRSNIPGTLGILARFLQRRATPRPATAL
jgi:hypothetical protein